MMKILIFWDVYGRIWRAALKKELPKLKEKYTPDFTIVNIENITSWRGPIEKHAMEIEWLWIDLMTWWDHIFDNIEKIKDYLNKDNSKLIRPANFYEHKKYINPWKWYKIIDKGWKKLLVIHLIGETFINHNVYNPFFKLEEVLEETKNQKLDAIVVDFHKEVTSEWYWLAYKFDWKISFVYWTHTHVQTNDEYILPKWTWILSDVWMNWPLKWVIWADFSSVEKRFLSWIMKWKIVQNLDNDYVVNWVFVEIWEDLVCKSIEKIRIRGSL